MLRFYTDKNITKFAHTASGLEFFYIFSQKFFQLLSDCSRQANVLYVININAVYDEITVQELFAKNDLLSIDAIVVVQLKPHGHSSMPVL